ncbi:MAG TPA: YitT family protein [Romboutsia timonensis]|uniref:YitT family protein n=1 Tax=Romboutsia timonensis TaxID=1776391 RepID=A0A921T111_9FIRM|nr:YitT family protein [uncultured Romboutsia sp.]HJG97420.1 YitT family protein [Romboutsia timonensis]
MKKNNFITTAKEYILLTLGVILVAFGIQYFYAPNEIAGGGLSGMALVISHYIPKLSVGTIILIGNLILFAISFILVGGDFGFKTIYASFMLSFVMDFMEKILHSYALTTNMFLVIILGTIIIATGLGIAFAINASTGGTDILAKILNKYSTFNIGISLLLVDLFVVVCGGVTFGLDKGIYSLIAVIVNGLLVDLVIAKIDKVKSNNKIEDKKQLKNEQAS